VYQRHRREAAFALRGGALFRETLERKLTDFELQMLLLERNGAATRGLNPREYSTPRDSRYRLASLHLVTITQFVLNTGSFFS